MKIVTSAQMKAVDAKTIREHGIPGLELMERAGLGVLEHVENEIGPASIGRALVLCGRGNNGGDGFVFARKFVEGGGKAEVFLVGKRQDVKGDAKTNLERLEASGVRVTGLTDEKAWRDAGEKLESCTFKVDAILGTGAKGPLADDTKRAINLLNSSHEPCVAIDVPTGLDSDTGSIDDICVKAALTVAIAALKKGLVFHPGREYSGRIRGVDIGVPEEAYAGEGIVMEAVDDEYAKRVFPFRSSTAHKGDSGRVLIIGGSVGMTGAISLACQSAMRAGAGLVFAGVPASLNDILETKMTEPLTIPLPETKERTLALSSFDKILGILPGFDALAIGPGLSRNEESAELARRLIGATTIPTILDADGLNAFEGKSELLRKCNAPLSITPHAGEMARLLGIKREDVDRDRVGTSENAAGKFSCVTLLKGAPTVISAPPGKVSAITTFVNITGSAALATAGSGDVLTGTILAFLGQGLSILDATLLGAYVHGLAGEISGEEKGVPGAIASDAMESIPTAMMEIVRT